MGGTASQRRQPVSEINYQALRLAAENATPGEWCADDYHGVIADAGLNANYYIASCSGPDNRSNKRFIAAANPATVLALLDENESMCRDLIARNGEIEGLRKLVAELEETKSKLNEQREYYEGVISDGSKRIAELEKSEEQLISERDHAESALADMYFAATGDRPEWSNLFGFSDAVDAVVDRIADLEAKQPSPVVPEGLIKAVRFYEQVKRENPPVETGAWKDAVDWVLKEACQAVNIGIKGE
ncbi:ead/Ea22-like family protein [Escherichia coli]|uniref:ead/Ea22-like family protein n=1 Tax=Escherichia coli TaxID=562 RepID=UPI00092D58AA|nr:ead/Ea22-like family protein [Escherichia coli]EFE1033686.1 ead/Ea22-like family protein [Escherichia coli O8:H8]EFE2123365.1 ead/Ea22-like family protein [Escherichia coli O74:H8]EFX7252989.1 ead/Ea22-like family protein [Shigella sonnei]EED0922805.1 ead/Ea22-like family protein [Escherichia coli]